MLALYIISGIVAFLLLVCLALSFITAYVGFARRADKNPLLKYFTAEELGLEKQKVDIYLGKTRLAGYVYSAAPTKETLIIFCHGMGPGHCAYMREAEYLCRAGYKVLAFDYAGCGESEGKSTRGFFTGVKSVVAAIDYAKNTLCARDIVLVGHSLGAYSALCAAGERKVSKVVALSAPASPSEAICHIASSKLSAAAYILKPFVAFWLFVFGGRRGNANAAKIIVKSQTPALLIHGSLDVAVPRKNSAAFKAAKAKSANIKVITDVGKAHNPYNTAEAEKRLAALSGALACAGKMTEDERKAFFSTFDYTAATEQDGRIMGEIAEFIAKND